MHQALFRRRQTDDDVVAIATDDLDVSTGRARQLATLADLEFNVVDDSADRNGAKRHRIARLHVGGIGRDHLVAGGQTLRRQDVGLLAVFVLDQRDEGGAVRIVFETLDRRDHVLLGAPEIDDPVGLLVAAAAEARGDAAVIVATARGVLTFGQRLDRRAFVQRRTIDGDQVALARCGRIVGL